MHTKKVCLVMTGAVKAGVLISTNINTLKSMNKACAQNSQPDRLLVPLHLVGAHFTDFTCQWNQTDKQKWDLWCAAQCYWRIPLSLCFNPFNSTFCVSVDVRTLLRHLETQPFYPPRPQAYFYKRASFRTCIGKHTHPQQCRDAM